MNDNFTEKEKKYDLKIGQTYEIRWIPIGSIVREGWDSHYSEMKVLDQDCGESEWDPMTKVRYIREFHDTIDHIYEQKYIDQDNWLDIRDGKVVGQVFHDEDSKIEVKIGNYRKVKLIELP